MPLVSLKPILAEAKQRRVACLGLVCLGWEDATAFVAAAEAAQTPVVLSAGPSARALMPITLWGQMFRTLGEAAAVPVVAHLDHGNSLDEARAALDAGFTSLMIDGSPLPLAANIARSAALCDLVQGSEVSVEAELGKVGYQTGANRSASSGTDPQQVETFLAQVPCDCLAVSIGNRHLQTQREADIDWQRIAQIDPIAKAADCGLVIHGGSGLHQADRRRLADRYGVQKFNIGTELRQAFGAGLRAFLHADPEAFDRITLLSAAARAVQARATSLLQENWQPS